MMEPGPLLAAGRDADIFEYGPGHVLRRSRAGRSLTEEARVMEYVRSQGYPVPAVDEMSDDGFDMVMERIEGTDMVATMTKCPWTIPRQGRVLADLHRQLHELRAPDWLHDAPVGRGDRLLHLDLHPLNVMMGPRGPVVIDWTGACRGDPAVDVALAWVLMAAGEVPTGRLLGTILGRARSVLVQSFLRSFDVDVVKQSLGDVVAWKILDPHMSVSEHDRMWQLSKRPVGLLEADEAAGGQDHGLAGKGAEAPPPTDRPTGAAAFSEAQMAEEDSEPQEAQKGSSQATEANRGSDEQAAELLVEQIAEAEDSVT